MWLINTSTIELQRVDREDLEWTLYAILSHTWGKDEVTFEEMILSGQPNHKLGYAKIENTCRLAKERGVAYAWVDTCWTLQELIGSQNLDFHDSAWQHRGTKSGLRDRISDITRIDITVLKNNKFLESILIDKRISWAINRKTTRIEDLAYCLISIFDVNMPMMYGEGTKESNDTTQDYRGILAQSPAEFAHCRRLSRAPSMRHGCETTKTDKGLRLETFIGVFLTKTAHAYVRSLPTKLLQAQGSKRVTPFVSLELKHVFAKNLAIRYLWDQHGQSVITSNSEHFTGFLNFKISCLRGDTSAADWFIVVCGLTANLSDDLRPWIAIYDVPGFGCFMLRQYSDEELYLYHLRDRLLLGMHRYILNRFGYSSRGPMEKQV
ncbi:uncharacterized protein B0J16DRAFT_365010 [Fusarium flagelliforme]|uniref:uncharacterized protein n=1 Tax=Fusarium flagelliforme TaxID=2675880 RepID=UPI001E8CD6B4|nr:uncharacterized protein B0J16DRAFT_365010 [Fusarium flagelliforme]KAH7175155.1 hypothetical protein B0J16DRAFT_365010 [Fusarium flagelliforme]